MLQAGLSDLDALTLRCRDRKARSYVAEAVTCVKVGAFRAAIVITWVAVVHDLLAKLEEVALSGDANAQVHVDKFRKIVTDGDVKASLEFERTILDVAHDEFEFFGPLTLLDLGRLRDDRHRCAHPSMIDPDTDYQPSSELARSHLVSAVTHLLEHGPAQGKAALDRLLADLDRTYFPRTTEEVVVHLEHGPLAHPRASLVRGFCIVLLKEYLKDPPAAPTVLIDAMRARLAREQRERRLIRTLVAVVRLQRELALAVLKEKLDALVAQASDARLLALLRLLAALPDAWHALLQAQRNRLDLYVRSMPVSELAVGIPDASSLHELRGAVAERFSRMNEEGWVALARVDAPTAEWVELAVDRMAQATTWSAANAPKAFLVAAAHLVSEDQAKRLLAAATKNDALRTSFGIKDTLAALVQPTNLGADRVTTLVEEAGLTHEYSGQPWWPK